MLDTGLNAFCSSVDLSYAIENWHPKQNKKKAVQRGFEWW